MKNIFEFLKDAPKGLKLYSPLCGECEYGHMEEVLDGYDIYVTTLEDDYTYCFNQDGIYVDGGECLLFPSKEHRTWDNWQEVLFQVGDVVTSTETENTFIIIFKNDVGFNGIDKSNLCHKLWYKNYRYATPEEREQFTAELNANGYKWNADTRQIEKIEQQYTPKYKVGDYIVNENEKWRGVFQITSIDGNTYYNFSDNKLSYLSVVDYADNYRLATEQELIDAGIKDRPLTKDELKPTQFVLVRDWKDDKWHLSIFSNIDDGYFRCIDTCWEYCIPYNDDTKHLLGQYDNCPDKYRNMIR